MKIKYSILFLIVNYIWVVGNLQLHSHVHDYADNVETCDQHDHQHTEQDKCAVCYFQFTPNSLVDFHSFELTYYPNTFIIAFDSKPISKTTEKLNAGLFGRGPPDLTV